MKDADLLRQDLMTQVAAERRRMIEKTVERHGLNVDVDKLVGATVPTLAPADSINEEALKEEGDEDVTEEGNDGRVRSEPTDASSESGETVVVRGKGGRFEARSTSGSSD